MAINTDAERAVLYKEFCEWCYTVPHLELDPRLHTHGGRIEDGGYISNGVTAKAFAAWKAARCAPAAPQPQEDARDNLLTALENLLASITGGQKQCGHEFDCVCPEGQARAAIAASKEQI